MKTILIPEKNRKDLAEVPTSLKRKMAFIAVKDVADVLKTAIAEDILSATPPKPREAKPRKKKAEA